MPGLCSIPGAIPVARPHLDLGTLAAASKDVLDLGRHGCPAAAVIVFLVRHLRGDGSRKVRCMFSQTMTRPAREEEAIGLLGPFPEPKENFPSCRKMCSLFCLACKRTETEFVLVMLITRECL